MKESAFTMLAHKGLREAAGRAGHALDWYRIESGTTTRSVPDVFARWASFDFWLEMKVATGWQVKFQPGQPHWLMRQWGAKQNAFVLIGKLVKGRANAWLYRGDQSMKLAGQGMGMLPAELVLPAPIDWDALLERVTWGGCPDTCKCTEGHARG